VHRWSILIIVQPDATQISLFLILQVHSTCFGCQPHPSWVHKTVTTASGTGQLLPSNVASTGGCNYSFVYSWWMWLNGQAWPRWREVAAQKIWPVPETIVTVLCTPDDGCGWHPKHVERSSLATLEGGSCTKKYDQYRRLYLQFCVLLMMGVVDTRNI